MNLDIGQRLSVEDLIAKSAMLVDRMEFDSWIECFDPEARYMVIPRENRDQGYPAALINCANRAVLDDRITVLLRASKYNPHRDRHILGRTEFKSVDGVVVTTETNFMIVQSSMEGVSRLFCAGSYEDKISVAGEIAKFKERVAIVDTFSVPNLIATPI